MLKVQFHKMDLARGEAVFLLTMRIEWLRRVNLSTMKVSFAKSGIFK